MKRLVLVYNPRSSRFFDVRREVLNELYKLEGVIVGKYAVLNTNIEDNAQRLKRILREGDLVIAVGGDGTVSIAVNAIMQARGVMSLGILPYGNFNDTVKNFGTQRLVDLLEGKTVKVWPLEAIINDRHFRFAVSYFTMGLFAEACRVFDEKEIRKILQKKKKMASYSWLVLAKWYFRNRFKRVFLPRFKLNNKLQSILTTDVVAMNGARMAGVMRGKGWLKAQKKFLMGEYKLKSFWRLSWMMMMSILGKVPGREVDKCVLEFIEEAELEIQAEGEYTRLKKVRKIEIRKATKCLNIIKI